MHIKRDSDVFKAPDGKHLVQPRVYLRVQKNGNSRSFLYRFMQNGKNRTMSLGSARIYTLAMIRQRVSIIEGLLAQGKDPRAVFEEKNAQVIAGTFADLVESVIDKKALLAQWKNEDKEKKRWRFVLTTYAVPFLGKKRVDTITTADVVRCLSSVWFTKPELGKRLRIMLDFFFDHCHHAGLMSGENPARWKGNIALELPPKSKIHTPKHVAAPTLKELQIVYKHLHTSMGIAHLAILFGILTCTRVNEFLRAKWSEIDFEKNTWTIPAINRKDGKKFPHRVPISTAAQKILFRLPMDDGYIFKGHSKEHINFDTPRILLTRLIGRPVTMHGCRSTFRDWAAETGQPHDESELSLMHSVGDSTEVSYKRTDLLERRRTLLELWAAQITALK